jgi:hypothetical protein
VDFEALPHLRSLDAVGVFAQSQFAFESHGIGGMLHPVDSSWLSGHFAF